MHADCAKPCPRSARRSGLLLVSALLLAGFTASGRGVPKQAFPRLGGYQIGGMPFKGRYADPAYHRQLARLDYVILGSVHPTINESAAAIRRLNPSIILAKYTKIAEMNPSYKISYWAHRKNKIDQGQGPNTSNAFDWWARTYDGEHTSSWPGNWNINITRWTKPDASGDRYPEFAAKHDYETFLKHDVWDGVYEDCALWQPRGKKVDWSGGRTQDRAVLLSEYRLGHKAYWDTLKRLMPGKYIFVNDDWYRFLEPDANGRCSAQEYEQQVHGGLLENILKEKDLTKPRNPFPRFIRYYHRSMAYLLAPKIIMFVASGDPGNYRFVRYAFAACLMNDGYFDFAPHSKHCYGTVEWFDEFDLAGTATTSWLGLAVDKPPTGAWKSGVWRRNFEGGTALVNPVGNGEVTVTIQKGFRRIAGRQDPVVNNGQPASRITLQDGDGIVLVRRR